MKLRPDLLQIIQEISDPCWQCREHSTKRFRFRSSFLEDKISFNHELAIDVMLLNNRSVFNAVDTDTHVQFDIYVDRKSADCLWRAITEFRSTVYLGLLNVLCVDQEATFQSEKISSMATTHGINFQYYDAKVQNAIASGERYHAPLRRVYVTLITPNTTLSKRLTLKYALNSINCTANIEGFGGYLLVFGFFPMYAISIKKLPAGKPPRWKPSSPLTTKWWVSSPSSGYPVIQKVRLHPRFATKYCALTMYEFTQNVRNGGSAHMS